MFPVMYAAEEGNITEDLAKTFKTSVYGEITVVDDLFVAGIVVSGWCAYVYVCMHIYVYVHTCSMWKCVFAVHVLCLRACVCVGVGVGVGVWVWVCVCTFVGVGVHV